MQFIYIYIVFIFSITPIYIYIIYLTRQYLSKIYYFFSFLLFFLIIFFLNFFFSCFFLIIFFYNFWRFFKFFKKLGHTVYFKKISIYIAFWQYLCMYMYKFIFNIYVYICITIYNYIYKMFDLYMFKIIINNFFIFFFVKHSFFFFIQLYNFIIILKKILFNLKFIEFFFYIYNLLLFKKKDLNYKYLDDPVIFRNKFLKIHTNINFYINLIFETKYYIKNKKIFFLFLFFFLDNYIKIFICKNFNIIILKKFVQNIYNNKLNIWLYILKKYIILIYYYIYFIVLNSIYCIIMFSIYFFFFLFNFLNKIIKKYGFIIKILIIILFLFYFYWIINYLLLLLYKHYILYIPLFNIKENFRFLNFEWIDLRNYFNIVKLHNVLIDLNIHNNIFYNSIIKQLNFRLNNYNVKFSPNFNVNLFTHIDYNKLDINKDTVLLNNIFEKWNKYHGAQFLKRWKKYKRLLNWHLRHLFKGKDWYKSMKKERLRGSNLDFFNSGRYFENSKNEISNNLGVWDNLHQIKKLPYNKEKKIQFQKTQAWYTYFKKRHTSKKRPRFHLSTYIKLKHVPLGHIYKELNMSFIENYKLKKIKEITFGFEKYFNKNKYIDKSLFLLKNWFIEWKYFNWHKYKNKVFFFKKLYRDFITEQGGFVSKNNIPSLLVTEMRIHRLPPDTLNTKRFFQDYISMSLTDEMSQFIYYKDLSKKSCIKNIIFKVRYIYKKYPYKVNKKNKYYLYVVKNYFNVIDTGIKISKKFFFFERSKLRNFNKLGHRLLNKIDTVYCNQLLKYKYWDRIFYLKRLNKRNLDFWGFFDYLKANKYILSNEKNDDYFTTVFLDRWKKDYYHMRIYLLRIIAFLHYYTVYKKIKINNNFTLLDWISDIKVEGAPVNLESLSTLNSLKFLNEMSNKNKVKDIMDDTAGQEQEQINETFFYHFKYRWHIKELLNSGGIDSYGNKDKFMFIINLFYKKFNKYFIEYNKINEYNSKYKFKIKSYKVKVLRKIKNLKKYFFFNTKRNKGWRIFSYLNTFSIGFHIKHLLWHSPYSYLLFKKNNISNNENIIKSFNYYYYYNRTKYSVVDYNYIFNLFLNILDIKEEWAFYLTDNVEYAINSNILNLTFYYVYNYGNFFYFYLNEIDIFRIFNFLLKSYYDNFLIKLTRYRYILELNDYTIFNVILRYLKQWYNSSYIKIRYFIYQIHETYVKYLKRKWLHFFRKKYWIRSRVDLVPFWFFFDYYIKCLIKYLFNKYFVKWHFIIWWLNYRLNFSFFFFFD